MFTGDLLAPLCRYEPAGPFAVRPAFPAPDSLEGADHEVLAEAEPVNEQHHDVQTRQLGREHVAQRVAGQSHEPSRDRRLRDALRHGLKSRADRLEADPVAASQTLPASGPRPSRRADRSTPAGPRPARPARRCHQRPAPGPADRHLAPAQGDTARPAAMPPRRPARVVATPRAGDGRDRPPRRLAAITCTAAPTADASRPSLIVPATSAAITTHTDSGSGTAGSPPLQVCTHSLGLVVLLHDGPPPGGLSCEDARHPPPGRSQAGTPTSTSTTGGTTSAGRGAGMEWNRSVERFPRTWVPGGWLSLVASLSDC